MITKDDYVSDRFILSTGKSIAKKFITQKTQQRSLDRDMSLYKEIECIEFETVDSFKCNYVEFKSCAKLSKSVKKFSDLIYTGYGSSIKELYSIDRISASFTESTLYQLRIDSQREGGDKLTGKFYVLNDHVYIPEEIETLNGLILCLDQYELDEMSECTDLCESAWDKDFIAPDSMLEDVISYTLQNLGMTKQLPEDEKPDLNNNTK